MQRIDTPMIDSHTNPTTGQVFAWCMVAATVLLTTYGQLMLKWEVQRSASPVFSWMAEWPAMLQLLARPGVISALTAAFGASLCWMLALKKIPLNTAYPFMSTSFILVAIAAIPLFGETLTAPKIAGLLLIIIGLICISQG
jgi:multidrug transporter EmrE-like cation transporter